MTVCTTLPEYSAICASAPQFVPETGSQDGSTVIDYTGKDKKEQRAYKLTHEEIEMYSGMYATFNGREYNVLNVLLNKARDINMCERYKDHDRKSAGRANTRAPTSY